MNVPNRTLLIVFIVLLAVTIVLLVVTILQMQPCLTALKAIENSNGTGYCCQVCDILEGSGILRKMPVLRK